jgi:hypothetical protein
MWCFRKDVKLLAWPYPPWPHDHWAYARDLGLNDFARQGSTMSSMSWGSQRGLLTDLSPNTTDVKTTDMFDGATATAVMISMGGRSYFKLTIRGID